MAIPPPNLPLSSEGSGTSKPTPDSGKFFQNSHVPSSTDSVRPPQEHPPSPAMSSGGAMGPISTPAGTVPGGGADAPDPFSKGVGGIGQTQGSPAVTPLQRTSRMQAPYPPMSATASTLPKPPVVSSSSSYAGPFTGVPPVPTVGGQGAGGIGTRPPGGDGLPPIAPPAFQQPPVSKRSKRWIILVAGGGIVLVILVVVGIVVVRALSGSDSDTDGQGTDTTVSGTDVPVDSSSSPPVSSEEPLFDDDDQPTGTPGIPYQSPTATGDADFDVEDTDKDDLTNAEEVFYKTDTNNPDTDGDGYRDGEEVRAGYDPLSPGKLDSDNDGFTDPDEREFGSDPYNPDTDGDGYTDGEEIQNGYNPLIPSPGDKL